MSTLEVSNISDKTTSVPAGYVVNGSAKMHGRINMATSSILASLNVSSILDHGTGTFSFVCTASFVNASSASCVGGAIREASWADGGIDCRQSSASNVFLKTVENDTDHDASNASAIGIGDLA